MLLWSCGESLVFCSYNDISAIYDDGDDDYDYKSIAPQKRLAKVIDKWTYR